MQEYESWYHSNNDEDGAKNLWPNVKHWIDLCNEASVVIGKDLNMGPKLKGMMEEVGFVDVQERIVKVRRRSSIQNRSTFLAYGLHLCLRRNGVK